jgi:biotin transporter BioY
MDEIASWGDIEFLILNVVIIGIYYTLWPADPDELKDRTYKNYASSHTRWLIFTYPRLSLYKAFWAISYASAATGYICGWIYLQQRTVWYVSVLSLSLANVLVMHFWHIAYWRWHNTGSLGTAATLFLWATSGGNAALLGFQANQQGDNLALWIGGFGGWTIYFIWATYVSGLVLSTHWKRDMAKKEHNRANHNSSMTTSTTTTKVVMDGGMNGTRNVSSRLASKKKGYN